MGVGENGFLLIGKIVGVHGLKGAVKAYSYAESEAIFEPGGLIQIRNPKGCEETFKIEWARPRKRSVLLALKGIENRSQAETLVGSDIVVEKSCLPELEDGSYYWFDIIGLSVFTTDGKYIGNVESIFPTGSNDVYVVKNPNNDLDSEILVPALESVVLSIDLKNKKMHVNLPEGLEI
jgi:16S rRNA processing protein RimM